MRVLVVEDDAATRQGLEELLEAEGAEVAAASTLSEAREALVTFGPEVCVTDLRLPDGDGLELLRESRITDPTREVLVLTGHGSIDSAVEAMKAGAYDYLTKPLKPAQLTDALARLKERHESLAEAEIDRLVNEQGRFGSLVGSSPPMRRLLAIIARVARSEAPVFITGESGSGKEVVAITLHRLSRRSQGPFVAVNCGAVSGTLFESELFGHERGSFTGADRRRTGYFGTADGGTLFLDEVTETSLDMQVKLLRVLETKTFRRVGGNDELNADVRVVSTSNRDLKQAVRERKLREDLYFRLNVLPIVVPPLRERLEDLPLLVGYFLSQIGEREGAPKEFAEGALEALRAHPWRGNVRELRNVVHRAYVLSEGTRIDASAVRAVLGTLPTRPGDAEDASAVVVHVGDSLEEAERRLLKKTLEAVGGHKRKAAEILGISLKTMYNKLNRYGIGL